MSDRQKRLEKIPSIYAMTFLLYQQWHGVLTFTSNVNRYCPHSLFYVILIIPLLRSLRVPFQLVVDGSALRGLGKRT